MGKMNTINYSINEDDISSDMKTMIEHARVTYTQMLNGVNRQTFYTPHRLPGVRYTSLTLSNNTPMGPKLKNKNK